MIVIHYLKRKIRKNLCGDQFLVIGYDHLFTAPQSTNCRAAMTLP